MSVKNNNILCNCYRKKGKQNVSLKFFCKLKPELSVREIKFRGNTQCEKWDIYSFEENSYQKKNFYFNFWCCKEIKWEKNFSFNFSFRCPHNKEVNCDWLCVCIIIFHRWIWFIWFRANNKNNKGADFDILKKRHKENKDISILHTSLSVCYIF